MGILDSAQKAAQQGADLDQITDMTMILSNVDRGLATTLPELLGVLSEILDSMTEKIVEDGLATGNPGKPEKVKELVDSFSAVDFITVRDASSELNDWKGMFAAEKNSFMAMMPDLMGGLGTSSESTGGQDGNQSSLSTAGVGKTSGDVQQTKSSNTSSTPKEPAQVG